MQPYRLICQNVRGDIIFSVERNVRLKKILSEFNRVTGMKHNSLTYPGTSVLLDPMMKIEDYAKVFIRERMYNLVIVVDVI